MIAFSPGVMQGCFDLLELVDRSRLTFVEVTAYFARLGQMPSGTVVETSQTLRWVNIADDGYAKLTPTGIRVLGLVGYEPRLRQALLDYVDVTHPPWLQNATFGRAKVLDFANNEIGQVFIEAGLADGTDDEVVEFWDLLSARAHGQKNTGMCRTGRKGERLTLAYEEQRTGRPARWVSIDNNEDGYDVLSIVGNGDQTRLCIEVKTTTAGLHGNFHVTANEWDRAGSSEAHAFHLWDIQRTPRLVVLSGRDIEPHISQNRGSGRWETVEIPFSAFAEQFAQQKHAD